jgi:hypothetical protein
MGDDPLLQSGQILCSFLFITCTVCHSALHVPPATETYYNDHAKDFEHTVSLCLDMLLLEQRDACMSSRSSTCLHGDSIWVACDGRSASGVRGRSSLEGTVLFLCSTCHLPLDREHIVTPRWRTTKVSGVWRRHLVRSGFLGRAQHFEIYGMRLILQRFVAEGVKVSRYSHDQCSKAATVMAEYYPGADERYDTNHYARHLPKNLFAGLSLWFSKARDIKVRLNPLGDPMDRLINAVLRDLLTEDRLRQLEQVFLDANKSCESDGDWDKVLKDVCDV